MFATGKFYTGLKIVMKLMNVVFVLVTPIRKMVILIGLELEET